VLSALVLLIAYGAGEGWWTNRCALSGQVERAAARLERIPRTVGDWVSPDPDQKLSDKQIARAEITGYVLRRYVNQKKGEVTVLLICGRTGPTSLHGPEVCYLGAGYNQTADTTRQEFEAAGLPAAAEFRVAQFQKNPPSPEPLRLYWSWSATGAWETPASPRFHFGRFGALYKLYVIRELSRPDEPAADDPSPEFLRQFLPEVHKALFQES